MIVDNEVDNTAGGACTYVTPEGKAIIAVNTQASPNKVTLYELADENSSTPLPTPEWENLFEFTTHTDTEVGLEGDGTYFYTSNWETPEFYKYSFEDGSLIESYTIPNVGALRDMSYCNKDGLIYGSDASMNIYAVNMQTKTLERTINVNCTGVSDVRHIAYDKSLDNGEGGFWIGGWNDLGAIDMDGNELVAGITHGYGMSGTAYDNWTNPGNTTLWCYTQDYTTDNRSVLVAFDINTRTFGTAYDISSSCTSNSNGEAGGAMSFVHTEAPHLNNAFIMLNTQCDQEPNAIRVYLQWSGDGLKELNSNRGLAIFPNPAQNVFTINRPSADNSLMQIYDLSGRVVFSEVLMQSKTQIDISGLYASSYIVKVNNRVEKLIVQ